MVRYFSIKYRLKHLNCLCPFLTINSLLFLITYSRINPVSKETSSKLNSSSRDFPFLIRKEQSFLRYFQQKEKTIRRSPSKIIIHNELEYSSTKTSFLIYEHTRHREFCKRKNNALIYARNCPFQNCQFTCNSSLISKADAVLMVTRNGLNLDKLLDLLKKRNSNQRWLFWHDEPYPPSPIYNKFLFNWTITYRLDAEISVAAYGITFLRDKPMKQSEFNQWINRNYQKRRNEATWFVSNCRPKARLAYYHELKKHFPILAFGKCIINETHESQKCTLRSNCEFEKLSTSKFYLAFESTPLRTDYITEKFWRSLSYGAIPIVLDTKRRDYERVAPPNSFIYANDYRNHRALARHLSDISTNQTLYEKYHKWRIHFETRYKGDDVEPFRLCELCYKLNTNRDRIWYTNINQYFLET